MYNRPFVARCRAMKQPMIRTLDKSKLQAMREPIDFIEDAHLSY